MASPAARLGRAGSRRLYDEYDALADIYPEWSAGDPNAEPCRRFYARLCPELADTVVEFGVGDGRIAVELLRRGLRVIGVDSSRRMLDRCLRNAAALGCEERLRLVHADVREFVLDQPATLITFPFRSFGHLRTREERVALLDNVHRNLAPGGRFVFDHYVFDEAWARAVHGTPRLMHGGADGSGGLFVWDTYLFDFPLRQMRCFVTIERTDPSGCVTERVHRPLSFSWVDPAEVRELARETGFDVEEVYGDFDGGALEADSADQIWLLRRGVAA